MKGHDHHRDAERVEEKKYTRNDKTSGHMSLAEILTICDCGRILIRKPGQTIVCIHCGAMWDGKKLSSQKP